jgi:hypothetical protein
MRVSRTSVWLAMCVIALAAGSASANPPTGAIFTTVADGSEVNYNIYAFKTDVYLDGGPGVGAPASAAGLDDGTYVYQITDPPGKNLLSTDPARCRQFTVVGGLITGVVAQGDGCQHVTSLDVDHNAVTVQMYPFDDTPNNGGEYKAWAITVQNFLAGCSALGVANGLNVVDCGSNPGNQHGFVAADSKTDNFKVKDVHNLEIDTHFVNAATGAPINGLGLTWIDTLGGSNRKFSYSNARLNIRQIAHVEDVERGTHRIVITDQAGCKVTNVHCYTGGCNTNVYGPTTVNVTVKQNDPIWTKDITVSCQVTP